MTYLKKLNIKLLVMLTYLVMIAVNALANIIPINNITTGEVSDAYANLFAPAAITFAIWGVIYLLLFCYSLYILIYHEKMSEKAREVTSKINPYFIFSNIVNTIWILAWHFDFIFISLLLMLLILFSLISVNLKLRNKAMSQLETVLIKVPFNVYLGWITIATVANVVTYLVSINWNGFGLSQEIWMNIIIVIALIIAYLAMNFFNSISYGLVIIWSYSGILTKHFSKTAFNGQYSSVIAITSVALAALVVSVLVLIVRKLKVRKRKVQ